MSASHHTEVVLCPNAECKTPIRLSVGKFDGGYNDKGGVVIECSNCHLKFPCWLKNPNDASCVSKNGTVVATWTDEFPDSFEEKYGINKSQLDNLNINLVFGYEEPPATQWSPSIQTFFTNGHENFEFTAKYALDNLQKTIKDNYNTYGHHYVKRTYGVEKSFVIIEYQVNRKSYKATFAKRIKSENDLTIDNLYLIDHSSTDIAHQIDGIYTRNQLLVYLERLMNRWRYTAKEILLVVPFIGFFYKNAEEALYELWNWMEMNVDAEKTRLITRKATFNLFKQAQDSTGIPFDTLVELGLLEPMVENLTSKDAEFYQKSHAKYYVGVYDNYVEVLAGSFNIHGGSYFENMIFKRYEKEFFKERYLHMFKNFEYNDDDADETVHFMTFGVDNPENLITSLSEISLKQSSFEI